MTAKTTLSILFTASALMLGGSAYAAGIAVPVAGRNPAAVRSDIVHAAVAVCHSALSQDRFGDFGSAEQCVSDTVDAAMSKLAAVDTHNQFAQADISPAH